MSLTLEGVPREGVFELVTGTGAGQLITDIRVMDRDYLDYETEDRRTTTFTVGRLMSLSQMTEWYVFVCMKFYLYTEVPIAYRLTSFVICDTV